MYARALNAVKNGKKKSRISTSRAGAMIQSSCLFSTSKRAGHRLIRCFVSCCRFNSANHSSLNSGRALQYRPAIFNYVAKDSDLREHELSSTEWDALTLVTGWLKYFRSATTQMSSTKQPMLSTTHAIFRGLQDHIKGAITALPEKADPALRNGLVEAHGKLSDYYTKFDQSRYYLWASCNFFNLFHSAF